MIVLDTDHVVVLAESGPQSDHLKERLKASDDSEIAISIISVEEQMRGWLAEIRRSKDIARLIRSYGKLSTLLAFWRHCQIMPFDDKAAARYASLRKQIRIGTQDLKIAAVALANRAKLLTGNTVDFERVPGLDIEDWLD